MIISAVEIKLYASWVHSLKEKRMVLQSIVTKVKNKFNVSIAEVGEQDTHQTIVLGIACVSSTTGLATSMIDKVIAFIEENTDAEILDIRQELR